MRSLRSPHSLANTFASSAPLINPGKWLLALLAYPQAKRVTFELQLSPLTCQTAINGSIARTASQGESSVDTWSVSPRRPPSSQSLAIAAMAYVNTLVNTRKRQLIRGGGQSCSMVAIA
jgi:hypothetical protein